ncbi:MAG TPA: hypothetical protein VFM34_00515 [Moraxellaceae bacterium]|nr:hypothetical protein [Moraxellaceae bacterium]
MTEREFLAPAERDLAATVRDTLERKAAQPDPLMEAALAAARARATEAVRHPVRVRHPWWLAGGFAVAASVALVFVALPEWPTSAPVNTVAENTAMPDADLQFLQDMDMLVAMNNETTGS